MAKIKKEDIKFVCQNCGFESIKWLGKCPECLEWNTFVEEVIKSFPVRQKFQSEIREYPKSILEVENKSEERLTTGINEFDRVLGGGIVNGSFVLIGGEPGIGKSTLLLQASNEISKKYGTTLYVSGEESSLQTRLRAGRLGSLSKDLFVVSETNLETIDEHIVKLNPKFVVIDSIQTVFRNDLSSSPGSVGQVRESAASLMNIAKGRNIPIFLVGHVTKDGSIAGPRVLEHIVDTVLYFEGDRFHSFRILRAYKNRFGPTDEIAVFEMVESGLKEISNPSAIFLSERLDKVAGSVVVATIEGTRPILVEVQALISTTYFGIPQRKTSGIDYNRFSVLLAVLEKRAGFHLGSLDVFVNVVGGVKIVEPASDLSVAVAVASSIKDSPVSNEFVIIGELGLGGEIRGVTQIERRINEAKRLGFKKCIIPFHNIKSIKIDEIEIKGVKTINEALSILL